ncbi:alanine racemase [Helicobacter sp.]|uniref:alanine racemase n=1 Tax=Helicobacter sp. TaxID=218 RepID=UPI0025BC7C50|nr:alanine racemase [Helicobacter sp.]MBR2495503.1 alanine racemase [Helicobacter sp.]
MAYIRLDSQAFFHNLTAITNELSKATYPTTPNLALVLKDNAYGHGLKQMAHLAKEANIESVFVKNYEEAISIAQHFRIITALYGEIPPNAPSNIWASIPSLQALQSCITEHKNAHQTRNIELKIDIGMHRNGITINELDSALAQLENAEHIRLAGVFGHNGYGDNDNENFFTSVQAFREVKDKVCKWCEVRNDPIPRFHSLSTSGALRLCLHNANVNDLGDLVRIGIGAYGYHTSELTLPISLVPVASLYAQKISSLYLKKGDKIGYGGVSVVQENGVFSTYDVGYGDGLLRVDSRQNLTCASGEKILPVMSMDCFSCQSEKEEICVFSDVSEWAKEFGAIPYMILTHLSPTLKRVVV